MFTFDDNQQKCDKIVNRPQSSKNITSKNFKTNEKSKKVGYITANPEELIKIHSEERRLYKKFYNLLGDLENQL